MEAVILYGLKNRKGISNDWQEVNVKAYSVGEEHSYMRGDRGQLEKGLQAGKLSSMNSRVSVVENEKADGLQVSTDIDIVFPGQNCCCVSHFLLLNLYLAPQNLRNLVSNKTFNLNSITVASIKIVKNLEVA